MSKAKQEKATHKTSEPAYFKMEVGDDDMAIASYAGNGTEIVGGLVSAMSKDRSFYMLLSAAVETYEKMRRADQVEQDNIDKPLH